MDHDQIIKDLERLKNLILYKRYRCDQLDIVDGLINVFHEEGELSQNIYKPDQSQAGEPENQGS